MILGIIFFHFYLELVINLLYIHFVWHTLEEMKITRFLIQSKILIGIFMKTNKPPNVIFIYKQGIVINVVVTHKQRDYVVCV
jgi:hypothetical protein